jgi:hypothetical protein
MPSTHQSGQSGSDRKEFPDIESEIGEDPARFLDRPLAPDYHTDGDTTPMALAKARIRGIRKASVAARWLEVEHHLDRGPRESIVERLEQKARELNEHGDEEVPGRDPEELRERAAEVATESVAVWPDRSGGERSSTYSSVAERQQRQRDQQVATDGGEDS